MWTCFFMSSLEWLSLSGSYVFMWIIIWFSWSNCLRHLLEYTDYHCVTTSLIPSGDADFMWTCWGHLTCTVAGIRKLMRIKAEESEQLDMHFLVRGDDGNGPLTRYAKLRVAHAPGMPGTFSPPPRFSDPDMHNGTCMTHVPWCMPGSLVSGFIWSWWRGKRSRYPRRMRKSQIAYLVRGPWQSLIRRYFQVLQITSLHNAIEKDHA